MFLVPNIVFNGIQCGRNTGGSGKGSKSGSRSAGGGGGDAPTVTKTVNDDVFKREETYSFKVGENDVSLNVSYSKTADEAMVNFKINNSFDRKGEMSQRESLRAVLTLRRVLNEEVLSKKSNQGKILSAIPYSTDGFGASRERAYRSLGFGAPGMLDVMSGRIQGGKLVPINSNDEF